MRADYESVSRFVTKHGSVTMYDNQRNARTIADGGPDLFDFVEKADQFVYNGKTYSRAEFEVLLNDNDNSADVQ